MAKKGAKSGSMHGGWTKRNKIGFMYVSIWIFGFLLFQLYPFICSLVYSFTDYDIFSKPEFVGFANYIKLFTKDKEFWNSLIVTLKYTFITVPGKVVLALIIAVILNKNLKGINFIRTVYYIPSLLSGSVAVAILWKVLFMNDGFVNSLLGCFKAERNNTMEEPNCQISSIHMVTNAISGVPSHFTGSILKQPRRLFTKPSFINSTFHKIATATEPLSRDGI
jgi:oligogalacturonide transport system permease protein